METRDIKKEAATVAEAASAAVMERSKRSVRRFFDALTEAFAESWHCDTPAKDFVTWEGERVFDPLQTVVVDAAMGVAFEVFEDPYKEGMRAWKRAKKE